MLAPGFLTTAKPDDLRLTTDLRILLTMGLCLLRGLFNLLCILIAVTYIMAPVKCQYHDCVNTTANKSLFSFPVNDGPRLKLWIQHSGNINLTSLTHQELRRRYICEDHFKTEDVVKNNMRSRLLHTAVPLKSKPVTSPREMSPDFLKVKTPQKCYQRKRIDLPPEPKGNSSPCSSMLDAPVHTKPKIKRKRELFSEDKEDQPEVKRLKKLVIDLKQKNKEQRSRIRRLSSKGSKKKRMILLESLPFSNEIAKTMAAMQLRKSQSRKKWTKQEKELCLSIYYKSPATYIHMRRQGIVMAAPSTIRKWLDQTNCLPGIQDDVFKNVEQRFKNATLQEKACVLAFDEMSIMSSLEYSKKYDQFEGFQDFGKNDRAPILAKYVLVFLIRGLYSGWKLPIAYFLSAGNVTAAKLSLLIKVIINKLFNIGLLPKAIVSDQITTNQKALKDLGVSYDSPFFFCNGRKLFAFFDIPHALKNIRNHLLAKDLTDGEKIFSFSDVVSTYEIDKKNKSKSLHKLTPAHINPNNFQKMKVSLAAQVFSRSVAATIRTVVGTGELNSQTALDTANFIEVINNAFDALNSKRLKSKNPYQCAISKCQNRTRQALQDGKKMLSKLKKIVRRKNGAIAHTRPPSFDGFLQSIEGVLQMFEEESSGGIKFILTSRLNQDVLENLFAIFRLKSGFNRNPSARVLRTIFRSNLVNALIKTSESKNCMEDEDIFIDNEVFQEKGDEANKENLKPASTSDGQSTSATCSEMQGTRHENIQGQQVLEVTLEECSVAYFAGYLAKNCLDKYSCEKCWNSLIKGSEELNEKHELLILNKVYPSAHAPKLLAPSEALLHLVDASLNIFKEHFESLMHQLKIKAKMYQCIQQNLYLYKSKTSEKICEDHEKFIIEHLLLVKMFDYSKAYKKNVMENKLNSKLRILKNL